MNPRLSVVTSGEVIKAANKIGLVFDRQYSNHVVHIQKEQKSEIVIPIQKEKIQNRKH